MRLTLLLLLLAGLFGLAAVWQERHVGALRGERDLIEAEASGEVTLSAAGPLSAGQGLVWIGAPSGAQAVPRPQQPERRPSPAGNGARSVPRAAPQQPPHSASVTEAPLRSSTPAPYSVEVQPEQTLSGICYLHYGTASVGLVRAVAEHNGLDDPNRLRVGDALELPELDSLR